MPQRNGAAIDVKHLTADSKFALHGYCLRGKGLVHLKQFDGPDVVHTGAVQCGANGPHGAHAHNLGRHPVPGVAENAGHWLHAELGRAGLRQHEHRCGAIIDSR